MPEWFFLLFILGIIVGEHHERRHRRVHRRTASIELLFGDSHMANGSVALGSAVTVTINPREADGVTLSGGTVSGANWSISDPNFATFSILSNTTTKWTPTGTVGTATISVTATVTDLDGVVVANLVGVGNLTVTAGANDARTVSIDLTFTVVPA